MRQAEWREPSAAQPKDQFGQGDATRYRLTAHLHDGFIRWRGWFDSREEADVFLAALAMQECGLPVARALWDLPSPAWCPDIGPHVLYEFAAITFLTAGAGANQSFPIPTDWNNVNKVEGIGGGGCGRGRTNATASAATGGGGGAYMYKNNVIAAQRGAGTFTYLIGVGGPTNANPGTASWFNGTSSADASMTASFGGAGQLTVGGAAVGGAAGTTAAGRGDAGFNGGAGGGVSGAGAGTFFHATGGGGAAGPGGVGSGGANIVAYGAHYGSDGGASATKAGGAGPEAAVGDGVSGGAGTDWDATHGAGSGGGAGYASAAANRISGAGGNYGGGSGAVLSGTGTVTFSPGAQGIVVITYTPIMSTDRNLPRGLERGLVGRVN